MNSHRHAGRRFSPELRRRCVERLESRQLLAFVPELVADICQGPYSSDATPLAIVNGTLLLTADDGNTGKVLWKSDGTATGTSFLNLVGPPAWIVSDDTTLYFSSSELWKSDGTQSGTKQVKEIRTGEQISAPHELTLVNGWVFFIANDGIHGDELWKSDGSESGTTLVRDIKSGPENSNLQGLVAVGDTLFFLADDGLHGLELWKSDGTEEGTVLVTDIRTNGGTYLSALTAVGNTLYFVGDDGLFGRELWKSDGTAAGTLRVSDGAPGAAHWNPAHLTNVDGTLFFSAADSALKVSLFKSDGTQDGTVKVKRIQEPSGTIGGVSNLTNIDGTLYFSGNDGVTGNELWVSDGTESGTRLVKDISTAPPRLGYYGSSPGYFTSVDGRVYFVADDGVSGQGVWVTNGGAAGTYRVAVTAGLSLRALVNFNDTLYFSGMDSAHGRELWRLVPDPVLGDTDGDGDVDLNDVNTVRNHFGESGDGGTGDTDSDGDVDLDDLNNVRNNFGAAGSSQAAIAGDVRPAALAEVDLANSKKSIANNHAGQKALFRIDSTAFGVRNFRGYYSTRNRIRALDQLFELL